MWINVFLIMFFPKKDMKYKIILVWCSKEINEGGDIVLTHDTAISLDVRAIPMSTLINALGYNVYLVTCHKT